MVRYRSTTYFRILRNAITTSGQAAFLFGAEFFAPPGPLGLPALDSSAVQANEAKIPPVPPTTVCPAAWRDTFWAPAERLCGAERQERSNQPKKTNAYYDSDVPQCLQDCCCLNCKSRASMICYSTVSAYSRLIGPDSPQTVAVTTFGTAAPSSSRPGECTFIVKVIRRNICVAETLAGGEVKYVECNAVCSLDGDRTDPELRGNLDAGVFCNAAHDEHEPAKYVEASMNGLGLFDQQS